MAATDRIRGMADGNLLLLILLVSFVILHVLLFNFLEDRLKFDRAAAIELNLQTTFAPSRRQLPQPNTSPHSKLKQLPVPAPALPKVMPRQRQVPIPKPSTPSQLWNRQLPAAKDMTPPDIIPVSVSKSAPRPVENPQTYFDLVRSRIAAHKIYPESARKRREEGSVRVRFAIARDGQVISVEPVGGTTTVALRTAAADAVRRASPFPRLPESMGKEMISIKVTIHFKLD